MKIFVLDDMPIRIKWFRKHWPDMDHADNPPDAIEFLRNNKYEMIFLDNDLGGAPYVRGERGDGIDLAIMMAKEKIQTATPIIVHSLNFDGAHNIVAALKDTHTDVRRIPYNEVMRIIENED